LTFWKIISIKISKKGNYFYLKEAIEEFTRSTARSPAFEEGKEGRLRVNLEQAPALRPGVERFS
jgi:hypothetical protein